jgi:hypothetical protein
MKSSLIGYACIILVLLTGVTLVNASDPYTSGHLAVTSRALNDLYGTAAWAEWMEPPRRTRKQNPQRYWLPRKQRRRLQLQLRRIRKKGRQRTRKWQREAAKRGRLRLRKAVLIMAGVTIVAIAVFYLATSRGARTIEPFAWQDGIKHAPHYLTGAVAGVFGSRQRAVVYSKKQHFHPEFDHCLICEEKLRPHHYLQWRKAIQMMSETVFVTSQGRYCPQHPETTYLSAEAAHLSLPNSTYGLDVLARIGYQRDYGRMSWGQVHESLPDHIRVSQRHLSNLYREYTALLACAERLDVEGLKSAAAQYGGLILSVDGLEPEGGQPQLWVVRELLTGSILAAGWLPRVDEATLKEFLTPVKALDLPFLATISDKQSALVKALQAAFPDLPNQYCQAHFLSNSVTPIYEADEKMKTQLRKQVRAEAGATMRQAQAEVKQKRDAAEGRSPLIATGLAARPPAGLEEVKRIAQAAQERLRRGETISLDEMEGAAPTAEMSAPPTTPPTTPPQTVAQVREALRGSNVMIYERRPAPDSTAETAMTDRQQAIDELVEKYAARLRRVLSRSGRKPFRLAGLRLYVDLLTLLGSLEISLTHIPNEARLTCFADAIRNALLAFEDDYTWIAEGYSWVLDISDILDVPLPEPGAKLLDTSCSQREGEVPELLSATVQSHLDAYLERLQRRTDLNEPLLGFRRHLQKLTKRYAPGLFHCYDIPGLPRTNNDLESLFGRVRRQTLLTSGPHHAKQRLHEEGAWLLFDILHNEHEQVERLRRVPLSEWHKERQRIQARRASFTDDRRFRQRSPEYLAALETQAAQIANL